MSPVHQSHHSIAQGLQKKKNKATCTENRMSSVPQIASQHRRKGLQKNNNIATCTENRMSVIPQFASQHFRNGLQKKTNIMTCTKNCMSAVPQIASQHRRKGLQKSVNPHLCIVEKSGTWPLWCACLDPFPHQKRSILHNSQSYPRPKRGDYNIRGGYTYPKFKTIQNMLQMLICVCFDHVLMSVPIWVHRDVQAKRGIYFSSVNLKFGGSCSVVFFFRLYSGIHGRASEARCIFPVSKFRRGNDPFFESNRDPKASQFYNVSILGLGKFPAVSIRRLKKNLSH